MPGMRTNAIQKLIDVYGLEWINDLYNDWDSVFDQFKFDCLSSDEFKVEIFDNDALELFDVFEEWIEYRAAWYKIIKNIKFKKTSKEFAWEDFHSIPLGGPQWVCKSCGVILFDNFAVCGEEYEGTVDYYRGTCSERCKLNLKQICVICGDDYKPFEGFKKDQYLPRFNRFGTCSDFCANIRDLIKNKRNEDGKYLLQVKKRILNYTSNLNIDESVTRGAVFKKFNGLCNECGIDTDFFLTSQNRLRFGTVDHIKPISKLGQHTWDNVQLLCLHCNSTKRDKIIM